MAASTFDPFISEFLNKWYLCRKSNEGETTISAERRESISNAEIASGEHRFITWFATIEHNDGSSPRIAHESALAQCSSRNNLLSNWCNPSDKPEC